MKETTGRFLSALAVVLVVATVACAPREDKDAGRANTAEIAEDAEALSQLRAAGSDLAKPHKVEFYLYVPTEAEAEAAAAAIRPLGYTVAVSAGEDEANWLCLATKTMLPTIEEITVARGVFKGMALKYQGAYGGWNTAIEH
jgi:hypothetical protein